MMNPGEPDLARVASWFADRSRVAMMGALVDGRALPAGELARAAGIGAAAASEHLAKLLEAGLVEVVAQGRHRYYRLASAAGTAELLETLAAFAPRPLPLTTSQNRVAGELKFARRCYGHLAGVVGVTVTQALFELEVLRHVGGACVVTEQGKSWLESQGVDLTTLSRTPLVRLCPVDWSERRPHLAGALGKSLLNRVLARGYAVPARSSRALRITERGRRWLHDALGVDIASGTDHRPRERNGQTAQTGTMGPREAARSIAHRSSW